MSLSIHIDMYIMYHLWIYGIFIYAVVRDHHLQLSSFVANQPGSSASWFVLGPDSEATNHQTFRSSQSTEKYRGYKSEIWYMFSLEQQKAEHFSQEFFFPMVEIL